MKDWRLTLLFLSMVYLAMGVLLTCGCAVHVGEAPCLTYARAVEARLTECGFTDDWYRWKLAGIYEQCDSGPLGLTFVDPDDANDCVAEVNAAKCERLSTGAPTCLSQVKL